MPEPSTTIRFSNAIVLAVVTGTMPVLVSLINAVSQHFANKNASKGNYKKEKLEKITDLVLKTDIAIVNMKNTAIDGKYEYIPDPSDEIKILINLYFPSCVKQMLPYYLATKDITNLILDLASDVMNTNQIGNQANRKKAFDSRMKTFYPEYGTKYRAYETAKANLIQQFTAIAEKLD